MSTTLSPVPISLIHLRLKPTTPFSTLSLPLHRKASLRRCFIKVNAYRQGSSDCVIRNPNIVKEVVGINGNDESTSEDAEEEEYIDWEDQIVNGIASIVRFVKMVLHSGTAFKIKHC